MVTSKRLGRIGFTRFTYHDHEEVETVPEGGEVLEPEGLDLDDLLDEVVEDEGRKDELGAHERVLGGRDVAEQLDGAELAAGLDPARRGQLEGQPEKMT